MAKKTPLLPPPVAHPDEPPFACIEINMGWIPYVIGALRPMKYPEYWAGTLEQNRTARQDVSNLINQLSIAGDCMDDNCCPDVPSVVTILHRLSPDGTTLEMSVDNGETWVQDNTDPRSQILSLPPPVPGVAATVCDAAENIVQGLKHAQQIISDQSAGGGTLFEIAIELVAALFGLFFLGPVAAGLLVVIAAAIIKSVLQIGKEAYDDLFTGNVWDIVRCAFACSLEDDGTITADGVTNAKHEIYKNIPGDNNVFGAAQNVVDLVNFVGLAGLKFLAATGNSSGADCSACECATCSLVLDFRELPYSWLANGVVGKWELGDGWRSTYKTIVEGIEYFTAQYEYRFLKPCSPDHVYLTWTMGDPRQGSPRAYWHTLRKVDGELVWDEGFNLQPGIGEHVEGFPFNGAEIYGFRFGVLNIGDGADHFIQRVAIDEPPP